MKFADALTLLFIALRLTHQIDWNWAFVVCPIFIVLINSYLIKKALVWAQKRNLQSKNKEV